MGMNTERDNDACGHLDKKEGHRHECKSSVHSYSIQTQFWNISIVILSGWVRQPWWLWSQDSRLNFISCNSANIIEDDSCRSIYTSRRVWALTRSCPYSICSARSCDHEFWLVHLWHKDYRKPDEQTNKHAVDNDHKFISREHSRKYDCFTHWKLSQVIDEYR